MANKIASQEDINEIIANKNELCKRGVGELEDIVVALEAYLENCSGAEEENYGGGLPTASAKSGVKNER